MALCAYHPDRPAVDVCSECRQEICSECRTEVAGKPVCGPCVEAIRSRVAAEMDARAPASGGTTFGATDYHTGGYIPANPYGPTATVVTPVMERQQPASPSRLLVGIALGVVFGVVGAFILKTIHYYLNFGLSFFNIILGAAVGYGVMMGSGRQGLLPAIISAALAFLAMMFSDYMLYTSIYRDVQGGLNPGTTDLSWFIHIQQRRGVMHWVCVAIGVWSAFSQCMEKNAAAAK